MNMNKKDEEEILKKSEINQNHIDFYNKVFSILKFILDEYSRELIHADIDYLEMPKNSIATMEFLISSITKVQKGLRIALGLDEENFEDISPQINIIEGIREDKI